jgi:hypothetical protein
MTGAMPRSTVCAAISGHAHPACFLLNLFCRLCSGLREESVNYQKIQSTGSYSDYSINLADVGEAPFGTDGKGWQLCLINTTNSDFEFASLRHNQADFGPWFKIPVVRNNCSTGYDMCFDAGNWAVILSLPPGTQTFDIRLATKPNGFGAAVGAEFLGVRPEPGTGGGVLGISIDG